MELRPHLFQAAFGALGWASATGVTSDSGAANSFKILAIRKKGKTAHEEETALIETYLHATGGLADTPLDKWAENHERVVAA